MKRTGNEAAINSRCVQWSPSESTRHEDLKRAQPPEELDIMRLASKRVNSGTREQYEMDIMRLASKRVNSGARQQHDNNSVKTIRSAHSLASSLTERTEGCSTAPAEDASATPRKEVRNTWRKDACAHSKGNHYVLSKIVEYMQTHTLASYFKNPSKEDRRKNSCLSDVTKSLMAASVLHVGGRFNRQADSYLRGFRRGLSYATDRLDQLIHYRGENPETVLLKRKLRPTDADGRRGTVEKLRRLYFSNAPQSRQQRHVVRVRQTRYSKKRKAAHKVGPRRQPQHESRVEKQPLCESSIKTQSLCRRGVKRRHRNESRGTVERQPPRKVHKLTRCESRVTSQPPCESSVKKQHRSESRDGEEIQTQSGSRVHKVNRRESSVTDGSPTCESSVKKQPSCESSVKKQHRSESRDGEEIQTQPGSRVHKVTRRASTATSHPPCASSVKKQPSCESSVKKQHQSESRDGDEIQTQPGSRVHKLTRRESSVTRESPCECSMKTRPSCESRLKQYFQYRSKNNVQKQPRRESKLHKGVSIKTQPLRGSRGVLCSLQELRLLRSLGQLRKARIRAKQEPLKTKPEVSGIKRKSGVKSNPLCEGGMENKSLCESNVQLCSLQEFRLMKSLEQLRKEQIYRHQELLKTKPGTSRDRPEELTHSRVKPQHKPSLSKKTVFF